MGYTLEVVAKGKKEKKFLDKLLKKELKPFSEIVKSKEPPLDGIGFYPEEPSFDYPELGVTLYCKIWLDEAQSFYAKSIIKLLALSPLVEKTSKEELKSPEFESDFVMPGDEGRSWLDNTKMKSFPCYYYDGFPIVVVTDKISRIKGSHTQGAVVNNLGMCSLQDAKKSSFMRIKLSQADYSAIEQELLRLKKLLNDFKP